MAKQRTDLDAMATRMVGDGGKPNLYFVSLEGIVIAVERSYPHARARWEALPRNVETCLEDRRFGVIASTEPKGDDDPRLVTITNFQTFARFFPGLASE